MFYQLFTRTMLLALAILVGELSVPLVQAATLEQAPVVQDPYKVLGVGPSATKDEIDFKYNTQKKRLSLEQPDTIDEDLAALDAAYNALASGQPVAKPAAGPKKKVGFLVDTESEQRAELASKQPAAPVADQPAEQAPSDESAPQEQFVIPPPPLPPKNQPAAPAPRPTPPPRTGQQLPEAQATEEEAAPTSSKKPGKPVGFAEEATIIGSGQQVETHPKGKEELYPEKGDEYRFHTGRLERDNDEDKLAGATLDEAEYNLKRRKENEPLTPEMRDAAAKALGMTGFSASLSAEDIETAYQDTKKMLEEEQSQAEKGPISHFTFKEDQLLAEKAYQALMQEKQAASAPEAQSGRPTPPPRSGQKLPETQLTEEDEGFIPQPPPLSEYVPEEDVNFRPPPPAEPVPGTQPTDQTPQTGPGAAQLPAIKRTAYEILGVAPDASQAEIAEAYRKMAKDWEDYYTYREKGETRSPEEHAKFRQAAGAYETLKDEQKRAEYNAKQGIKAIPKPSQSQAELDRQAKIRKERKSERSLAGPLSEDVQAKIEKSIADTNSRLDKRAPWDVLGVKKDASEQEILAAVDKIRNENQKILGEIGKNAVKAIQEEDRKFAAGEISKEELDAVKKSIREAAQASEKQKADERDTFLIAADLLNRMKSAKEAYESYFQPFATDNSAFEADPKIALANMEKQYAQIRASFEIASEYASDEEQAFYKAKLAELDRAYNTLKDDKLRAQYNLEHNTQLAYKGKMEATPEIRDAELKRMAEGMLNQALKAGTIDMNEVKEVNFQNIFLNKILSLIPQQDVAVFKNLVIRTPTFVDAPILQKGELGFAIQGSLIYHNIEMTIKGVFVRQKSGEIGVSFALILPEKWNFAQNYPALSKLDDLSFLLPQLIVSNFSYGDPELGGVSKGLNFVAKLNLTGPLQQFQELLNKWDSYLTVRGKPITLSGVITPDVISSSFSFRLPLQIGIDFNDLYKRGLSSKPTAISSVMTSGLQISITPRSLATSIKTGIELGLVAQAEPLNFNAIGKYTPPNTLLLAGEMLGMWDPAFGQKWLALGNTALEVGIDSTVTAAFAAIGIPMPINSLGLQGTFGFGEGVNRATTNVAGKIAVKAPNAGEPLPIPDFILQGSISKVDFTSFVQLLGKMVDKPAAVSNMPPIQLSDLLLRVAPTGGSIGSTYYEQGVAVSAAMQLGSFGGFIDFAVSNESKSIHGAGSISSINTPFFKFTGEAEGKDPRFNIDLSLFPLRHELFASGTVGIPLIGFSKGLVFSFDSSGLYAKTDSASFFNTQAKTIEIRIPFTSLDDLLLSYEMQSSTLQSIKQAVQSKLAGWRNSITKAMQDKQRELDLKIREKDKEIARLNQQKKQAQDECERKVKSGKFWKSDFWSGVKECATAAVKSIDSTINQMQADIKQVRIKMSEAFEGVPDKMFKGVSAVVDVATAFEINRISGRLTGRDLKEAKAPSVTIELTIDIFGKKEVRKLENMQFDFSNPLNSGQKIADAIIKFFS